MRKRTARDFQGVIAQLLREIGGDVTPGPIGADEGVDLLWKATDGEFIVQCKKWKAKVGVPVVREVFGAAMRHKSAGAIIVTTSEFTDAAKDWTIDLRIPLRLVDGKQLFDLMDQRMPTFVANVFKEANVARCPVCGDGVDLRLAKVSTSYENKAYYFWAETCLRLFQREPGRFVGVKSPRAEG
ncbi:MAG: restriction endonuclease [Chloroflexi bacterium]|nr:restriction endonuclease [Chloroflexota bacterium]